VPPSAVSAALETKLPLTSSHPGAALAERSIQKHQLEGKGPSRDY
jgi:hypothetical protein